MARNKTTFKKRILTDGLRHEVAHMYRTLGIPAIARKLGMSPRMVRSILDVAGIPRRASGGQCKENISLCNVSVRLDRVTEFDHRHVTLHEYIPSDCLSPLEELMRKEEGTE